MGDPVIERFLPVTAEQIEQCITDATTSPVEGGLVRMDSTTALVLARTAEVISRIPEDQITHPVLRANVRDLKDLIPTTVSVVTHQVAVASERDETVALIPTIVTGLTRAARLVIILDGVLSS